MNVNTPSHVNEDSGGTRFDYNLSRKYRLFARYFRDQGESSQTQNSTGSIFATSIVPQNVVVNLTQFLTPTVVNETKFGFNGEKTRVSGIPGPETQRQHQWRDD